MAKIKVYKKTFPSANILSVCVGTNSPQGGDASYGGRTVFRLRNEASTMWSVRVDGKTIENPTEIEIVLGGDCEAETFTQALEFAAKVLRSQIGTPPMELECYRECREEDIDFH